MNRVLLSIRIPVAQELMLKRIAVARGMTRYQALGRAIEAGMNAMMHEPSRSDAAQLSAELLTLSARLGTIEALADRSLFTASAAYAYARRAALRGDSDAESADVATGEAAQAAYRRQRALAAEAV